MDKTASFSLPITIGVTGHRAIAEAELPKIEQAVATVIEGVRKRAPHSSLLLLTSLAEGADRLVARVAAKLGIDHVAVLPRPAASYREDFTTDASKAEFDCLLADARHVIVESGVPPRGAGPEDVRRAEYGHAGHFVSLHAHLLIALWDGKPARGGGGTAQVIAARLKGRYPGLNDEEPLQYAEGGAVAHIVTTRAEEQPPADAAEVKWLYPEVDRQRSAKAAKPFDEVLTSLDRLNRLATHRKHPLAHWIGDRPPSHIAALKGVADSHARHFQNLIHLTVRSLAAATAIAAMATLLGSTATTIAVLAAAAALWLTATLGKWQLLHVDLRGLAEGARVQLAWTASGDPACVADHYHPVQAADVAWIRRALRTGWLLDRLESGNQPPPVDTRPALAWINEQVDYFLGNKGVVAKYRQQGRIFGGVGIACLVVGLVMLGASKVLNLWGSDWLHGLDLLRIANVVLALTASLQAYQAFMAFKDLERSYAVAAHLFRIIDDQVRAAEQAGDSTRIAQLTRTIGRAALVENVEWLVLKRQRRPKPPI